MHEENKEEFDVVCERGYASKWSDCKMSIDRSGREIFVLSTL